MKNPGTRLCRHCGDSLSSGNPTTICFACQEKKRGTLAGDNTLHYDVQDMMVILGLDSPEQVRRLGRAGRIPGRVPAVRTHLYIKQIVDTWIKADGRYFQGSNDPLPR
jgi:hypothetical protein